MVVMEDGGAKAYVVVVVFSRSNTSTTVDIIIAKVALCFVGFWC